MGRKTSINDLKRLIKGKNVVVFGAGPSLDEDLEKLLMHGLLNRLVKISADGATSALIRRGIIPDVIVTDLDGDVHDISLANGRGAITVVHAHGDNVDKVLRFTRTLKNLVGTTQVLPFDDIFNFGGFTDGDRCVFMADEMGAKIIILAGMDFGERIGRYSGKKSGHIKTKVRKLKIGKKLLEWLARRSKSKLYNLTSHGTKIKGFKKIEINYLRDILGDEGDSHKITCN